MADDDASGRFDKQNERGGETSAEGKGAGCARRTLIRGSMTGKNELLATCAYNFVHRLCTSLYT